MDDIATAVIDDRTTGSWADYEAGWLDEPGRDAVLAEIVARAASFEGGTMLVDGREVPTPRLVLAFGDEVFTYPDMGGSLPWPPAIGAVRDRLAAAAGHPFNYALVNWYRDGADFTGWHADKMHLHVPDTSIAIVSLGEARTLGFRPTSGTVPATEVVLGDGSLVWMRGDLQRHYEHAVPRDPTATAARYSVTFRHVLPPER